MENKQFKEVLSKRNELAHVLCEEIANKRANMRNKASEAANEWYDFVHEVLYEREGKYALFGDSDGSVAFLKQVDKQIGVFQQMDNEEVRRAFIIWNAMDNGEIGGL